MPILPGQKAKQDTNNAINAENNYYNQASGFLNPYTENAGTDFNTGRNLLYGAGTERLNAPKYGQNPYRYIESPSDLLQQGESSFQMNPAEQAKMNYSISAANSALNYEGMSGSGNEAAIDAAIKNTLTSQDLTHYLGLLNQSAKEEFGLTQNYEKSNEMLANLFQDLIQTEYKGSSEMGRNAMEAGRIESRSYDEAAREQHMFNPFNAGLQMAGAGYGIFGGLYE